MCLQINLRYGTAVCNCLKNLKVYNFYYYKVVTLVQQTLQTLYDFKCIDKNEHTMFQWQSDHNCSNKIMKTKKYKRKIPVSIKNYKIIFRIINMCTLQIWLLEINWSEVYNNDELQNFKLRQINGLYCKMNTH